MNFKLDLSVDKIKEINGRRIFLFDISVWNRLADKKTTIAGEVCELLVEKHKKGSLFCPLTAPTIWELRKQVGKSLKRTTCLMEQLSSNVMFRGMDQIIDYEIDNFLDYVITGQHAPLSYKELFGSILSYMSPSFSLKHPDKDIPSEEMKIYRSIGEVISNITLSELIEMSEYNNESLAMEPPAYQETNIKRRKAAGGDKNKMRRIEIEYIAQSIVIPKIMKKISTFPIETQLSIENKLSNLPKSKKYGGIIEHALAFLPLVASYVDILTISGYDINRKDTDNDFYDKEISIYGLAYSTVFSAVDKGIKHIIYVAKKEGNIGGLCYAGNLIELKKTL